MDAVSTEAMLQEANISTNSPRIINQRITQFFGRSFFTSEAKCRKHFGDSDFAPTVKTKVLQDKTIIPYWYNRPDHFIQSQLKDMINITKLKDLIQLDIAIGGDHGSGKFHVMMKVNFHLPEKKTVISDSTCQCLILQR
jgi:hypothetical protein